MIIKRQQLSFQALSDRLGRASASEIDRVLAEREVVDPEPELTPDTIDRLMTKIKLARS